MKQAPRLRLFPLLHKTYNLLQEMPKSPSHGLFHHQSAINAIGTSLPSGTASATTSPATVPDPPRYLTPTVVSPSQINLSWWKPVNSGGSAITGYKIEGSTDGGTTWNVIVANTGSALYINHYSNYFLLASTTYTYRVSTINAIGTSMTSSTTSTTTSTA